MARRESVLERQASARDRQLFGVLLLGDALGRVAHERFAGKQQQARILCFRRLAPVLETRGGVHMRRNARGVKRDERVVVDQHVLAPRLVLEFGDFGDQPPVVGEKWRIAGDIARHQCFTEEHGVRRRRIDPAVGNTPARHQSQAVECDAFGADNIAARAVPAWIEVRALDEFAGNRLDPVGLDLRRAARVQARRLGQLRRQHPLAGLARDTRSGMQVELQATHAGVVIAVVGLATDVRQ